MTQIIENTGFEITQQGPQITKDPLAQLIYTLDWSQWLTSGDSLQTVEFNVQTRVNDPSPLNMISSGLSGIDKTYIELASGQVGKIYVVTAKITTSNGLVDRRSFRVQIENRHA